MQQGKYIRARENPFFDGLKRGGSTKNRKSVFEFTGRTKTTTRSSSVVLHKTTETVSSKTDIKKQPLDSSSTQIDDIRTIEKSSKQVSLPPCAASFYSPQIDIDAAVKFCQSIQKLNMYLKASKDAVNAGAPGQFLRAVLGHVSGNYNLLVRVENTHTGVICIKRKLLQMQDLLFQLSCILSTCTKRTTLVSFALCLLSTLRGKTSALMVTWTGYLLLVTLIAHHFYSSMR